MKERLVMGPGGSNLYAVNCFLLVFTRLISLMAGSCTVVKQGREFSPFFVTHKAGPLAPLLPFIPPHAEAQAPMISPVDVATVFLGILSLLL